MVATANKGRSLAYFELETIANAMAEQSAETKPKIEADDVLSIKVKDQQGGEVSKANMITQR